MSEEAGFELTEHTADIGVRAWGPDLARAFAEAARGTFAAMVDLEAVRDRVTRRIEVRADDAADLLVRWLNELVYHVDAEGLVFSRFEVERCDGRVLVATARGEPLDPQRHAPRAAVKAATYHDLAVDPGPPARVRVLLDV